MVKVELTDHFVNQTESLQAKVNHIIWFATSTIYMHYMSISYETPEALGLTLLERLRRIPDTSFGINALAMGRSL